MYAPEEGESFDVNNLNISRMFNVNDFNGGTCYFSPNSFAKNIAPKEIDLNYDKTKDKTSGSFDSKTASYKGVSIKEICIKLKIDRLGNVSNS